MTTIDGHAGPGCDAVRDAFAQLFAGGKESGAEVCAIVDGETVVDLHGGLDPDALVNTFSVVKPFAALCALVLVDKGRLSLDDGVADHWPQFAQHGKDRATVRHALAHQAGVPFLREPRPAQELLDWDATCARIAAEPPHWEPGTAIGEHALTYGHIVGELVRRVDGRDLGAFWREEIAEPWGVDFHIGVPRDQLGRVADLTDPGGAWQERMRTREWWPPGLDLGFVNGEGWRTAQVPAVNGHGSARAIARVYAGLAAGGELDGVRVISEELADHALTPWATGPDRIVGQDVAWSAGLWIEPGGDFGMGGVGGSLGFGHRGERLAYAYVTTRMGDHDRTTAVEAPLRAITGPSR